MPNPYAAMNSGADWMNTAPSPYQAQMMGQMNNRQMMAPNDTSFAQRQAAIGQQLANQPMQAGAAGGIGGAIGGSNQQKQMADALRGGVQKLGNTINPYLPNTQQQTANMYGTNPYSDQSVMLAQQNQGFDLPNVGVVGG